jgi:hypothetical protein
MFRLPNPANKDREKFDVVEWSAVTPTNSMWWYCWLHQFYMRRLCYHDIHGWTTTRIYE